MMQGVYCRGGWGAIDQSGLLIFPRYCLVKKKAKLGTRSQPNKDGYHKMLVLIANLYC